MWLTGAWKGEGDHDVRRLANGKDALISREASTGHRPFLATHHHSTDQQKS